MYKRIIFLLIACLLLCAVLCACSSDDAEPTENGSLTPVTDDAGKIIGYERRSYNDDGKVTRLDSYDADQNYLSYVLYSYDDAGRLYTEIYHSGEGFEKSRIVYTYVDSGRLYEKAFEYPHGEATVERYNADGKVIEKQYYDTDQHLIYTEKLENGAWVRYDPTEPPATDDETE